MNRRGLRFTLPIAVTGLYAACSSTNAPAPAVTLLVTNATCGTAECTPLEIHGIVPKFRVPGQPPWGLLDIGAANAASTCLTLAVSDSLTAAGPDGARTITWTVADPLILTAVDLDHVLRGATREFVPADAEGWTVVFGGPSPVQPVAPSRCAS